MAIGAKITDHAARALARLLWQYRDKTRLAGVLNASSAQIQELENALYELWSLRTLDAATGAQLDVIGKMVKQPREGVSDAVYRPRIRARIRALRSSGLVEDVVQTLDLLVPTTVTIKLRQQPPAGFSILLDDVAIASGDLDLYATFVDRAKAAGVHAIIEYMQGTMTPETSFTNARATTLSAPTVPAQNYLDVVSTALFKDGDTVFVDDWVTFNTYVGIQVLSPTRLGLSSGTVNRSFLANAIVYDPAQESGSMGYGDETDPFVGGKLAGARLV